MREQLKLTPSGLLNSQFQHLSDLAHLVAGCTPEQLREDVARHLARALVAYQRNPMVNVRLAQAINDVIGEALNRWDSLQPDHRYWLAGACSYFSRGDDDEPDFYSPIGFEDDVEALNACLRFAGLDSLCLNVEDYDAV